MFGKTWIRANPQEYKVALGKMPGSEVSQQFDSTGSSLSLLPYLHAAPAYTMF